MPAASPSPSSSRSSVTPPPQIAKPKKKSNGKQKSVAQDHGKNEGEDLNWAYAPPPDAILLEEEGIDAGEFDWDTINNDDELELCLIRIPDSIKPKALDKQQVDIPDTSKSVCIGTLERKHANFDIWSIGNDDNQLVGGEEIKSLSCLLPRKSKNGKLYPAPKPFGRHLVIVAQPAKSTPDPLVTMGDALKNPPRFSYPKEVLKHAYVPYGSLSNRPIAEAEEAVPMDVDTLDPPPSPKKKRSKAPTAGDDTGANSAKGKKRKGEAVGTPEASVKKSKKTKVA